MIIKLAAFGWDKLTHTQGVIKAFGQSAVKPIARPISKIIPLADKLKTSMSNIGKEVI